MVDYRFTYHVKRDPRELSAMDKTATANRITARTNRNKFLVPFIGILLLILFLVGPGVAILLQIMGTMNPAVWLFVLVVIVFIWRRSV